MVFLELFSFQAHPEFIRNPAAVWDVPIFPLKVGSFEPPEVTRGYAAPAACFFLIFKSTQVMTCT